MSKKAIIQKMLKIDKAVETVSILIYGLKTKGKKRRNKVKRDEERQEVVEKVFFLLG